MKALESQKQLLIAESELNRAHLIYEFQAMSGQVHALANQAKTVGSIASAVASLVAGLASLRQKKSVPATGKPSWWQTLLNGARVVSSFWSEFRSRGKP
jgi:hypothetical protein